MFLKTENEITQSWEGNKTQPAVSVSCITYNHEKYISQAIDSFLMQETTFPFEILIHDDASTDKTAEIIRLYSKKYPNIIKPMLQSENQYSKGKKINSDFNYPRALGNYIAICEGDDYWTDPLKLQKQFNVLEEHSNLNLCLHHAVLLDDGNQSIVGKIGEYKVEPEFPIIPFEMIIKKNYGQLPTAATFFRASILSDLYSFFARSPARVGDIFMHILSAKDQGAYLIEEVMSCYRVNVSGSWNERCGKGEYDSHVFERAEAFKILEEYVPDEYKSTLQETTYNSFLFILKTPYASKKTKRKVFDLIKKDLSFREAIYYRGLTELNIAHRAKEKLKSLFAR